MFTAKNSSSFLELMASICSLSGDTGLWISLRKSQQRETNKRPIQKCRKTNGNIKSCPSKNTTRSRRYLKGDIKKKKVMETSRVDKGTSSNLLICCRYNRSRLINVKVHTRGDSNKKCRIKLKISCHDKGNQMEKNIRSKNV